VPLRKSLLEVSRAGSKYIVMKVQIAPLKKMGGALHETADSIENGIPSPPREVFCSKNKLYSRIRFFSHTIPFVFLC